MTVPALMDPAVEYAQVIVADQRAHGHSDYSKPAQVEPSRLGR